jgi:hypothetical protein
VKGMSAFSSFALTTAALGLVIGLALRSGNAQSANVGPAASEAFLPVVGLTKGEVARIHVVNLTKDPTTSPVRFLITFLDTKGVPLKPEEVCDARAGETCAVTLDRADCGQAIGRMPRCEFRAVVSVPQGSCGPGTTDGGPVGGPPTTDGGVNDPYRWSANLEILDRTGKAVLISDPVRVMTVSTCGQSVDGGV